MSLEGECFWPSRHVIQTESSCLHVYLKRCRVSRPITAEGAWDTDSTPGGQDMGSKRGGEGGRGGWEVSSGLTQ